MDFKQPHPVGVVGHEFFPPGHQERAAEILKVGDVRIHTENHITYLRYVKASTLTNTTCTACWDQTSGGSNNPHCRYCDGEGYMWSERIVKICFFRGVAPVYKPGNLATGQYPQADFGYLASDRATGFLRILDLPQLRALHQRPGARYDMLYELKVAASGRTVARWCAPPSGRS